MIAVAIHTARNPGAKPPPAAAEPGKETPRQGQGQRRGSVMGSAAAAGATPLPTPARRRRSTPVTPTGQAQTQACQAPAPPPLAGPPSVPGAAVPAAAPAPTAAAGGGLSNGLGLLGGAPGMMTPRRWSLVAGAADHRKLHVHHSAVAIQSAVRAWGERGRVLRCRHYWERVERQRQEDAAEARAVMEIAQKLVPAVRSWQLRRRARAERRRRRRAAGSVLGFLRRAQINLVPLLSLRSTAHVIAHFSQCFRQVSAFSSWTLTSLRFMTPWCGFHAMPQAMPSCWYRATLVTVSAVSSSIQIC